MPKVLTKDNRIKEISDYIANDKQSMAHLGFTLIPEEPCSKKCEKDCDMELHSVLKIEGETIRERQAEPIVEKITATNPVPVKRGKSKTK